MCSRVVTVAVAAQDTAGGEGCPAVRRAAGDHIGAASAVRAITGGLLSDSNDIFQRI